MSASRTAKSPKQRATEALGIAERKHAAALKREKAAKKALEQAEADVTRAASRLAQEALTRGHATEAKEHVALTFKDWLTGTAGAAKAREVHMLSPDAIPSHTVTSETAAILGLMDGDPIHQRDRAAIVDAILACAEPDGLVETNEVRALLTDPKSGRLTVYPRLMGSTYFTLVSKGVLVRAGWVTNEDRQGRNSGKPQMSYRLVRTRAAA